MKNNRTISYHEHYVQVGFYQNFSNQENEMLNAKLEVSQKNRITL